MFLPKGTSTDIEAHRPVVLETPLEPMTSRDLLCQHEDALAPRREGFVRSGSADAHILIDQLVAERASEWGKRVWMLTAGPSGAFGSICHPDWWKLQRKRVEASSVHALMKVLAGHGIAPG